jgi:hypothetical protein
MCLKSMAKTTNSWRNSSRVDGETCRALLAKAVAPTTGETHRFAVGEQPRSEKFCTGLGTENLAYLHQNRHGAGIHMTRTNNPVVASEFKAPRPDQVTSNTQSEGNRRPMTRGGRFTFATARIWV